VTHPTPTGRQLDHCDVCNDEVHRHKLVRTQVAYELPAGMNLLTQSSYDGTVLVCDASDLGTISLGPVSHECRFQVDDDDNMTEVGGSQTWSGAGDFRSTVAVDVSAYTSIVVSAQAGPYQQDTAGVDTFIMGLCDSSGANKSSQRTWPLVPGMRIWFAMDVADIASPLSSSGIYVYVTGGGNATKWFVDELQIEGCTSAASTVKPGTFIKTTGSAVNRTTPTATKTVAKVCPDCFEKIWRTSQERGIPKGLVEPPINVLIQEE